MGFGLADGTVIELTNFVSHNKLHIILKSSYLMQSSYSKFASSGQ